jgi:cyclopropane-fatty-acyl-phospholipid synthase
MKHPVVSALHSAKIQVNGPNIWDIQVHNPQLFNRVLAEGSLGLGEAYMDKWWDCEDLPEFFRRLLKAGINRTAPGNFSQALLKKLRPVLALLINRQSTKRSHIVGEQHYDAGNDLFRAMLGERMVYTCGYWSEAKTLDAAQEAKLDLVCRKLGLKKGDKILDIGCGWGSLLKFAAENYGVSGVGLTISKEQAVLAKESCSEYDIEIRVEDYRHHRGLYDHIASLGMFEHVGPKNYADYFKMARGCLKEDGLFLLHTIGSVRSTLACEEWMDRYIFPNGVLPSIAQIGRAIEDVFVQEDFHNFGDDYALTLYEWFKNFEQSWPSLQGKYGERFYRMWKYYLLSLVGGFSARTIQLWQIVFSPNGVGGGYTAVR